MSQAARALVPFKRGLPSTSLQRAYSHGASKAYWLNQFMTLDAAYATHSGVCPWS